MKSLELEMQTISNPLPLISINVKYQVQLFDLLFIIDFLYLVDIVNHKEFSSFLTSIDGNGIIEKH